MRKTKVLYKKRHYPVWGDYPYQLLEVQKDLNQQVYAFIYPSLHKPHSKSEGLIWTGRIYLSILVANPLGLRNPTLHMRAPVYRAGEEPPLVSEFLEMSADEFYGALEGFGADPQLFSAFAESVGNFADLFGLEPEISLQDYWLGGVRVVGDYKEGETGEETFKRILKENPALERAIQAIWDGDYHQGLQNGITSFLGEPIPQNLTSPTTHGPGLDQALTRFINTKVTQFVTQSDQECAQGFKHTCIKGEQGTVSLYETTKKQYEKNKHNLPAATQASIQDYLAFLQAYGTNRDIEQVLGCNKGGLIAVEWGREDYIYGEFTFLGEGRIKGVVHISKPPTSNPELTGNEEVESRFTQNLTPQEIVAIMDKYLEI